MNRSTDGELIKKAKEGEEWALDEFVERYKHDLLYYLWGEVCNKTVADDLYAETLSEVYQDFINIKKNDSARSYLFRIAYHNILNWREKDTRRNRLAEMVPILNSAEAEIYEGICEEDL